MTRFFRSRLSRVMALIALVFYLPTCTSWRVQELTPSQLITTKHPDEIRILRRDSTRMDLFHPTIISDTIVGITQYPLGLPPVGARPSRTPPPANPAVHVAVALSDVQSVEARNPDGTKTALLVLGITVPVVILIASAASQPTSCAVDTSKVHL